MPFTPITRRTALSLPFFAPYLPILAGPATADAPPSLMGLGGQYTIVRPTRDVGSVPIRTVTGDIVEIRRFAGQVVLLNFWATWCAPCAWEMPSLDQLAARQDADLVVLPVSLNGEGSLAVANFYHERRLFNLAMYFNIENQTTYGRGNLEDGSGFALYGLPISYVIDKASRVRGYIIGAVEWNSDEAAALLRYYTTEA